MNEQTVELSEDERKRLVVGQSNYLALMFLSLLATILSSNASWFCNFADREILWQPDFDKAAACAALNWTTSDYEQEVCNVFFDKQGVGFNYWYATVPVDTQVCMSYSQMIPNVGVIEAEFDAAFNAAKTFSVMANIFGYLGMLTIFFATCCPVDQNRIAGVACYFTLACVCQCFTFLIFASNICDGGFFAQYYPGLKWDEIVAGATCSLSDGGKQSVTASVLYALCSALAPLAVAPLPIGYRRLPADTPAYSDDNQQQPQQTA